MATTTKWYGNGLLNVGKGAIDLDSDTFKATLHTATYTPDQDADDFYNDATNELSTASGYTSGGVTLASVTLTYDAATNQVRWDFADPSWTFSASVTFRHLVIRKSRGGASSADELVCFTTWDANQSVSGAYTLTVDATGHLHLTAS